MTQAISGLKSQLAEFSKEQQEYAEFRDSSKLRYEESELERKSRESFSKENCRN